MKIMDRYLLREYLMSVFYCFVAFTTIYVLLDLFGHLSQFLKARTPLPLIPQYYLYWLLPFLQFLLPASLLFASLHTLYRLTRNSELTALRASGVSLARVMLPFLFVGMVGSLTVFAVNELVAPRTNPWVKRFRGGKYTGQAPAEKELLRVYYLDPASRQTWRIGGLDPENPAVLHKVKIVQDREDRSKFREISADRAEYLDGRWWLFRASVQEFHDNALQPPKGPPVPLPPAGVEMPELTARPEHIAAEVKSPDFLSALDIVRYLNPRIRRPREAVLPMKIDLHSRLAMPWACLIVTLFGIPTGARNARQNMITAVFIAICCFFGFFSLVQIGIFLAKKQILSPWLGAWLSNILFLVAGLFMARKLR